MLCRYDAENILAVSYFFQRGSTYCAHMLGSVECLIFEDENAIVDPLTVVLKQEVEGLTCRLKILFESLNPQRTP
jgi:hypothetical protein